VGGWVVGEVLLKFLGIRFRWSGQESPAREGDVFMFFVLHVYE
jgi:hypothetical protein